MTEQEFRKQVWRTYDIIDPGLTDLAPLKRLTP